MLRTAPQEYAVTLGSGDEAVTVEARFTRVDEFTGRLSMGGRTHRVVFGSPGPVQMIEIDGIAHRVSRDEGGVLRSQAPALVVATPVEVGDEVAAGDRVVVLESMKMETIITAPFAARVREVSVRAGSQVETGAPLARLEPLDDRAETSRAGDMVDLDLPDDVTGPAAGDGPLAQLRSVILGFDTDPSNPAGPLTRYLDSRPADGSSVAAEAELLDMFADIAELSRNQPAGADADLDSRVHSAREYFQRYLHSLDIEREQLPADFADRLTRVLSHYGVSSLDPSDELHQAIFRLFLLQQRWTPGVSIVTGLLQRWSAESRPARLGTAVRHVLERLTVATQRRFPTIGDLARSIRYYWFDRPAVEAEQAASLAQVPELLGHLRTLPDGPARRAVVEELVGAPDRLVGFLSHSAGDGAPSDEPLLSILAERHYRGYGLADVRDLPLPGGAMVTATYTMFERPTRLVSAVAALDRFLAGDELIEQLGAEIDGRTDGRDVVLDLYLTTPRVDDDADTQGAALATALATMPFFGTVRRVAVAVLQVEHGHVRYFTFRPGSDGRAHEDRVSRGVHPMVARQLNLWRLSTFDLHRLDAPRNILLLEATAKTNPDDQRLVALAQVRRLSIVRDAQGQVSGLPNLERALVNAVDAVRRTRAAAGPRRQLDHNHVWIHVWGEFDLDLRGLTNIERSLAPITADAGITEVCIQSVVTRPGHDQAVPTVVRFSHQPGFGVRFQIEDPPTEPVWRG